ncbi:hypothetical protein [Maritimibacter alkaliphilus]|uniref:hypothetical protein n=1 Tax=Maritimibacter alkaliphilus TaxID=404236 RepID=UPI001C966217|nr:hypothetical protein [Maritimibacter alkaliphilus]MBY6092360.1 hypothetical protein [Maritimibacter alkaliphilus]
MARSRRKTPIPGLCLAASDRRDRDADPRRERRRMRQLDLTEAEVPPAHHFGDPACGDAEGKVWFDPHGEAPRLRK